MIKSLPLVSIIIPVYNSEQFVAATIESVINQTYANIEIIIVDDGSLDNSTEIITRYAEGDDRIVYKRKQNQGPSLARRAGLDIAKGEYVQFLDSDDTLVADAIESLVERAESEDADMVVASFFFCMQNGTKHRSAVLRFGQITGIEYLKETLFGRAYWSLWSKFQKRNLLQGSPIDMMSDISFGEDVIWTTQLVLMAQKIVSLDKEILNYNERPLSLSHINSFNDKKYNEFNIYSRWIEDFLLKKGLSKEFGEALAFFHLKNTFMKISWRKVDNISKDMKRIIADLSLFPNLESALQYRERKIVKTYKISIWFGYLKLMRYIRQGKI